MPVSDVPPLRVLWTIVATVVSTLDFLLRENVISIPSICELCGGNISVCEDQARCTTRSCRKRLSCLRNSFFAYSRIPINDVLLLGYIWLTGSTYTVALSMTTHSPNTIVEYYGYFRQLVADSLDEEDWTIGGEGVIVEVDESKFGKRKYNRGHRIEGAWVIGGIERTPEAKFFVEVVERRDNETIANVLSKHLLPGTILHTDCWKGYCGIQEQLDVEHRCVNHTLGFVDQQTGVHTNTIEAKWAGLKRRITLRGRVSEKLPGYLFEQIWRARNKDHLWSGFISALKEINYD